MKTPKYPTETVTTIAPDGSLRSEEFVIVPISISLRVKALLLIRDIACWVAMGMLGTAELLVDVVDRLTSRWIPQELRLESKPPDSH